MLYTQINPVYGKNHTKSASKMQMAHIKKSLGVKRLKATPRYSRANSHRMPNNATQRTLIWYDTFYCIRSNWFERPKERQEDENR
jgi:hypothetical protein